MSSKSKCLWYFKTLFALSLFFVFGGCSVAFAAECNPSEADKIEFLAEEAAIEVMEEYGGGQDLIVETIDCEWNAYREAYKLDVEIYWNGLVFRSKDYNVDGILRFDANGKRVEFAQTYASESVKKLDFWSKVASGALILGDIALTEYNENN